jgi:hypothetical protein
MNNRISPFSDLAGRVVIVTGGFYAYPPVPGSVFSMTYEKRVTKNRVYAPSCCPFSLEN